MVTKVVKPAITSVLILVLWALSLNSFSIKAENADGEVAGAEAVAELVGVVII